MASARVPPALAACRDGTCAALPGGHPVGFCPCRSRHCAKRSDARRCIPRLTDRGFAQGGTSLHRGLSGRSIGLHDPARGLRPQPLEALDSILQIERGDAPIRGPQQHNRLNSRPGETRRLGKNQDHEHRRFDPFDRHAADERQGDGGCLEFIRLRAVLDLGLGSAARTGCARPSPVVLRRDRDGLGANLADHIGEHLLNILRRLRMSGRQLGSHRSRGLAISLRKWCLECRGARPRARQECRRSASV